MAIVDDFNKYVGMNIKNPFRITPDIDESIEVINIDAAKKGLMVNFLEAGKPITDIAPMDRLIVEVSSAGTGVNEVWSIKGFNIEPATPSN